MKKKRKWIPENKLICAMALFPGQTKTEVEQHLCAELGRRMRWVVLLAVGLLAAAICLSGRETNCAVSVERPEPGEESVWETVFLKGQDGWQKIILEVGALEYEEDTIEILHEQMADYLDEIVPGENKSLSEVETALCFPEEKSGFPIHWSSDMPWVVDSSGKVHNQELAEGVSVTIAAKIFYGSEFRLYERQITVIPPNYTKEERELLTAEGWLAELEKKCRTDPVLVLPEKVFGRELRGEEKADSARKVLLLLAFLLPLLVYQRYFSELEEKSKKREEQAKQEYPEFVTRLSLLLVAGVTIRQAMGRLAREYEKNYGKKHVLAQELMITWQEINNGFPEQEAYEAFGKRMGVPAYQRLAALLIQSVTKGVSGMRGQLLAEAKEVMATERAEIRVRGEKAGTKMMLPMMGFLILVFAVLLVPAFQMF